MCYATLYTPHAAPHDEHNTRAHRTAHDRQLTCAPGDQSPEKRWRASQSSNHSLSLSLSGQAKQSKAVSKVRAAWIRRVKESKAEKRKRHIIVSTSWISTRYLLREFHSSTARMNRGGESGQSDAMLRSLCRFVQPCDAHQGVKMRWVSLEEREREREREKQSKKEERRRRDPARHVR